MTIRARWVALLVAFALSALATSALADTITIGLQEAGVNGGAIITQASSLGNATVSGASYGTFSLNNISGTGAPFLSEGAFDSNSLNVSSSTAGTLSVYITDQGVTNAGQPGLIGFLSALTENSLTNGFSVTESTYVDTGNGLFALTTPLASTSFTAIGTDSVETPANIPTTNPFSVTAVYTITANGAGGANSTINVTAPEASSIALLSLVLLGGLVVGRKELFA